MHYVQKNTLYLAPLPRISANSSKNYRRYNCQTLANISGNLRQISGNIKYPKKIHNWCTFHTWLQSQVAWCRGSKHWGRWGSQVRWGLSPSPHFNHCFLSNYTHRMLKNYCVSTPCGRASICNLLKIPSNWPFCLITAVYCVDESLILVLSCLRVIKICLLFYGSMFFAVRDTHVVY